MEADLHVAGAGFRRAFTCEKPAQRSRAVLSGTRYIRQGDLANAGHAGKESGTKSGGKRKVENYQKEPEAKRTQQGQQAKRNSNIIYADGSDVGIQVENVVRMQEEYWARVSCTGCITKEAGESATC